MARKDGESTFERTIRVSTRQFVTGQAANDNGRGCPRPSVVL